MTFNELFRKFDNGGYDWPDRIYKPKSISIDTIFDENQSVKWNRDRAISLIKKSEDEYNEARLRYLAKLAEVRKECVGDIISAIMSEGFTEKQAEVIYSQANRDPEATYLEIIDRAQDLFVFAHNLLNCKE